jgi:hypothetical protein
MSASVWRTLCVRGGGGTNVVEKKRDVRARERERGVDFDLKKQNKSWNFPHLLLFKICHLNIFSENRIFILKYVLNVN